jgi:ABC-2 type transport system permease protein
VGKIFQVALRDFRATVMTKGFLLGVLIPPLLMIVSIPLVTLLVRNKPPAVKGSVLVIDLTGEGQDGGLVTGDIERELSPERLRERLKREVEEATRQAAAMSGALGAQGKIAEDALRHTPEVVDSDMPRLAVEGLGAGADVKAAKARLWAEDGQVLALVVVHADAVRKPADAESFGSYDLFVRAKMDMRVRSLLRSQLREAIVQARLRANGEDPVRIRGLTRLDAPPAQEVSRTGEQKASELRQMMVPLAFMMLLWISVFAGGQMLLTSTIEEKSNRIMEVLLSAVSPMQLMTGKIVGQMAASLCILSLYTLLGVSSLVALSMADVIEPLQIVFLGAFFFIAFFTIAAMMAAVGSAVNDLQEANALMTPVMLVVITPMVLMMPIIFNPSGVLATVLSFTPPINPFVMVLRLASSEPPPVWQVLVSIAIGMVTVYVMLWGAAKVFRIGVLMYGKPPNLATLFKWVRMA